ncbi:BZ3500_MvSof-1268-A1-R1_Chr6-3g08924 [Microbotryum saponariae]|uniref:BZ3500_MvSof-1268-A1-R1_Chr6-3g08924 protein n=1 Tax=Microbotryum saponariae TaxID=289078 RepID=A0A2X0MHR4_9BASI|nr:BZ3500_MvSof-1268-A1-R1_Chr6-3g08924 [Microbotryum saponariae]SDA07526.1 BZ3501_MvSof-1269-A2-R1_Chr6-2g08628 [Microbotryum saponariae]
MSTRPKQNQVLSIKGSTKICTEFFEYSVNNILYQRGIYPPDDFKLVKKYGLSLWTCVDESLERYIQNVMKQVSTWMLGGQLESLALVIMDRETREVVERWRFDVEIEDLGGEKEKEKENQPSPSSETIPDSNTPESKSAKRNTKTPEDIQRDIQQIMRQITSSVTFLPALQDQCKSFTPRATPVDYAKKDAPVPKEFIDSDPHMIVGEAESVKLRSFSTNRHKINGLVAYRLGTDMI